MSKQKIGLITLSDNPRGVIILPLLPSYVPAEDGPDDSVAHRHDYYTLLLLEAGGLNLRVDDNTIKMLPSSLLVLRPEQVHQSGTVGNVRGWIMLFDGKLLDRKAKAILEHDKSKISYFRLDQSNLDFFNDCLHLLHGTTQARQAGLFNAQLMHTLLNATFYKVANLQWLSNSGSNLTYTLRPVQITQEYKQLVKANFLKIKRPSAYARMLNISATYLNDSIKAITGFNASYFIQQEVIGEAQRQLIYTSKSIKEIAVTLGFDDHKYFTRLFSQFAGRSPSAFRQVGSTQLTNWEKGVMIFKTSVKRETDATNLIKKFLKLLPHHHINFDIEDCDHILRVEGELISVQLITSCLHQEGFTCAEMDD